MKSLILDVYKSIKDKKDSISQPLTSRFLETEIEKILYPEKYGLNHKTQTFFEAFREFLEDAKLAESRKRAFMVIYRAMQRYELYKLTTGTKDFKLSFDNFTSTTLREFEKFLVDEHILCGKYPQIYKDIPQEHKTRKSPVPEPRGQNTINGIFTKLRTFFIWSSKKGKCQSNPFKMFKIEESVYGTPFYISSEERNKLYSADFSDNQQLATQRDVFVFQCMIGCRIGDYFKMTKDNLISCAIEYIPRKTRDGNPVTVRVPLNSIAKEILVRYKDFEGPGLLPFISEQRYNDYIKIMFLKAELTRMVTVLNPTTRQTEQKPINEVASSHLARRCFVGNLYKKVKDPNLVGILSGHKEGSRAFSRYREIDEEMKTELVKMLE